MYNVFSPNTNNSSQDNSGEQVGTRPAAACALRIRLPALWKLMIGPISVQPRKIMTSTGPATGTCLRGSNSAISRWTL